MVDTVGKKLADARAARGLTLDEAAHATKIRPDKLAALEADDYSGFPNNTYARGFLLIYGRFLRVDVSELAQQLESGNPISVEDYQYLNVAPAQEPEQRARMRPRDSRPQRPSIAPLIAFFVLIGLAAFGVHFFMNAQRLSNLEAGRAAASTDTAAPDAVPATEASDSADVSATPAPPEAAAAGGPAVLGRPGLSDREFINPAGELSLPGTPAGAVAGDLQPNSLPISELSVEPLKTSWVRIRRNDPESAPIFEDFLYANAGTLRVKGTKFFVEVRDDGAVNLRKNGELLAYRSPGIEIQ